MTAPSSLKAPCAAIISKSIKNKSLIIILIYQSTFLNNINPYQHS